MWMSNDMMDVDAILLPRQEQSNGTMIESHFLSRIGDGVWEDTKC